jgi:hypothetical protein
LFTPGRPKNASFTAVSATSSIVPSIATNLRPAKNADGDPTPANGRATRTNNARTASNPRRRRAWKIADPDGAVHDRRHDDNQLNPSVKLANTSSYEPSENIAIPITKYATTRAGNDRRRCSVRPASAITSSTTSAGNTLANNPIDTKSDKRRSDTGLNCPARGTPPNYTNTTLT